MYTVAQTIDISPPPMIFENRDENDLSSEMLLINEVVGRYLKRNETALRSSVALSGPLKIDLDYSDRTNQSLPPLVPNARIFSLNRDLYVLPDVVVSKGENGHLTAFVIMQSYDLHTQGADSPVFLDTVFWTIYKSDPNVRIGYAPIGNAPQDGEAVFGAQDLAKLPVRIAPGSLIEQITL
jgi:hypothetical protein